MTAVLLAVVIGLGIAEALRFVPSIAAENAGFEPWVVMAASLGIIIVVLVAAAIPARRAARLEPAIALKNP
jgi:ABC-type antimicrobial peptide transport system permease subunit